MICFPEYQDIAENPGNYSESSKEIEGSYLFISYDIDVNADVENQRWSKINKISVKRNAEKLTSKDGGIGDHYKDDKIESLESTCTLTNEVFSCSNDFISLKFVFSSTNDFDLPIYNISLIDSQYSASKKLFCW